MWFLHDWMVEKIISKHSDITTKLPWLKQYNIYITGEQEKQWERWKKLHI